MGVIQGDILAERILNKLKDRPSPEKWLVLYVADGDPIADIFVAQHRKIADALGLDLKIYRFFDNVITTDAFVWNLMQHTKWPIVGGILITLPLPKTINLKRVLEELPPQKDVGAISSKSVFVPPAVDTVQTIFSDLHIEYKGKTVAVIGRGPLIGAPVAQFLKKQVGRLIWLNSKNFCQLRHQLPEADIIISGAGKKNLIGPGDLNPMSVVIDFGGDVDFLKCKDKANLITRPHNGVGPILIAHIFKNFYEACQPRA